MSDLEACLTDFAAALGCEPDNEAILAAIAQLQDFKHAHPGTFEHWRSGLCGD